MTITVDRFESDDLPPQLASGSNSGATTDSQVVAAEVDPDVRLYLPDGEGWEAHIKQNSEKVYCYSKHPGEDYFHLIVNGELYLVRDHEKYCLRCGLRLGILTQDRLFWQRRVPRKRHLP
jgi:hypothetical protein